MSGETTRVQPKRTCKSSTVIADIGLDEEEYQIPPICEECGHRFANETQLLRHMFVHDGKKRRGRKRKFPGIPRNLPEKRFKCDICESSFILEKTLRMHLTSHECEKFSCETCREEFPTLGCLQKHNLLKHTAGRHPWKDNPKPKTIDENRNRCQKKIELVDSPEKNEMYIPGLTKKLSDDDVKAIREKALMHIDHEMFPCEHCGAFFTHKGNYERHVLAHDFTQKVKRRPKYVKRIRTLEAGSVKNQLLIDEETEDSVEDESSKFLRIEPLLECELQENDGANDFTFTQKSKDV